MRYCVLYKRTLTGREDTKRRGRRSPSSTRAYPPPFFFFVPFLLAWHLHRRRRHRRRLPTPPFATSSTPAPTPSSSSLLFGLRSDSFLSPIFSIVLAFSLSLAVRKALSPATSQAPAPKLYSETLVRLISRSPFAYTLSVHSHYSTFIRGANLPDKPPNSPAIAVEPSNPARLSVNPSIYLHIYIYI